MSLISRKGYLIEKKSISNELLNNIKNDLTVSPFIINNYGKKPDKFTVYLENDTKICIPKFYGIKKLGMPDKILEPKFEPINVKFNGKLMDRQKEPYKQTLKGLKEKNGGILSIPCGWGKTVLALKLICKLKVKTLVIVHKTFLVNQWKERIKQFIPNAKIGMIQQDLVDIENKDIVIGMLQSISMKNYHKSIFSDIGFVICDEVHRISSKIFSRALPKTSTKYTLGLSATPKRDDGLSKIFYWYLGDMLFQAQQGSNKNVFVKCYNYVAEHEKFKEVRHKYTKKPLNSVMLTNITEIKSRNNFILNILKIILTNKLNKNDLVNRKILILSDRIKHLELLKDNLDKMNICTTGYYIGKMKEKQLNESAEKDVIFGTYPMASEGLDIPSLNTLILSTPRSKITQSVGRILRKQRTDIHPLVIDVIDLFSTFKNQGYKRRSFYKNKKYNTEFYSVLNEEIIAKGKNKKLVCPTLHESLLINDDAINELLEEESSDDINVEDGNFISSDEEDEKPNIKLNSHNSS
jgi:superfamily II DNA or RNA helicase